MLKKWDNRERDAEIAMEENVDAIENFLEDKEMNDISLDIYLYELPNAFEKLKKSLRSDLGDFCLSKVP